jgi:hypothetical protein
MRVFEEKKTMKNFLLFFRLPAFSAKSVLAKTVSAKNRFGESLSGESRFGEKI